MKTKNDSKKQMIVNSIRAKAAHLRYASQHHREDPEPQEADLAQTVSIKERQYRLEDQFI